MRFETRTRWVALCFALFAAACQRSDPAPSASASASASAAPVHVDRPPRPRAAGVLTAEYEKTPLALIAMANPVALIGRVNKIEPLQRCDCEKGQLVIERVIRDDSKLALAQKTEIEIIASSGALTKRQGRRALWVLRIDETQRSVSGWHEAPADGAIEVETALRSLAIEFERGAGPLPPLAIVTTRDGRAIWHRNGRVAVVADLSDKERQAADAVLRTFGSMGASENPSAAAIEKNAWRLRLTGNGSTLDSAQARSTVEPFAERLEERLAPERDLWRSPLVVVGKKTPVGDAGTAGFIVSRVLKNRAGETLAPGDDIGLDIADLPPGEAVLLLSSLTRDPKQGPSGNVFRALGTASLTSTEKALAELARYGLSAR